MAATDRPDAEPADLASDAAAVLRRADLAHLVAVADGDGLAAAGLLAGACDAIGVPYHVGVVRTRDELDARLRASDEAATPVALGVDADAGTVLDAGGPVAPLAYATAAALGGDPDAATALAGVVAAGGVPGRIAPDLLEAADLDRAPGVAVPAADLADGLAHTGLAHAAFSGDPGAAREALADVGLADADATALSPADAERVASLLALSAGGAPDATPRAAAAVERALRPYRTAGPFATLGGYADVLCALAERAPGLAVALGLGENGREAALEAWREHGRAAHAAVRDAGTSREGGAPSGGDPDGVLVARTDGPVAAVARLLRDFRSPAPVVLAVGEGEAAAASVEAPVAGPLGAAAEAAGGSSLARGTRGYATFDADRADAFADAFREAR